MTSILRRFASSSMESGNGTSLTSPPDCTIDTTTDGVSANGYGNDLDLAIAVPEDPQKAWDGLVDEVLIFNRVLDANEIRALYDSVANQFQKNYLGLGSGVHEFVGFSVNAPGDQDQTEVRNVTIY